MSERYARQMVLREVGVVGQRRLARSRVLCAGVGGLGAPSATYLAAAGVGHIGLVDADRVAISNLHRQILFDRSDVGGLKVGAAAKRLQSQFPDTEVTAIAERLDAHNILDILQDYEIVLDGTDNFSTKFLLNDACLRGGIPLVYASVAQFEGQVALLCDADGPCYRCLYPRQPRARATTCGENGVLGAMVGVIGSMQALEALKWLLRDARAVHRPAPSGTLWQVDGWTLETLRRRIPRRAGCRCGGGAEAAELLGCEQASPSDACAWRGDGSTDLARVHPTDLAPRVASPELLIVDVRDVARWQEGHIGNAVSWPLYRLENADLMRIPAGVREVVVYCESGDRSARACELLQERGIPARELSGGFLAWGQLAAS